MTIDNYCSGDDRYDSFSVSHAEAHFRVALAQSALFAARLAIARWADTGAAPQMAQADWYAEYQNNFQQWLGRGGFAQYPDDCTELAPAMYTISAPVAEPAGTDIPSAAS
ncbi:hypothetical protein Q4S45_15020 [Massilia sp. R2A-15]|uniref:hypothetical protein n=1 Tax=Massilia sp. R2A-15 TaxID=3064278 RepID=UPI002735DB5C|nr:hypothetical protein [Massilia sp. R2A-15]WLI88050.1 hypothetical protein Q4S45_15020 [Massilia sp. R2A-15]